MDSGELHGSENDHAFEQQHEGCETLHGGDFIL
jgi:hypothetical protein